MDRHRIVGRISQAALLASSSLLALVATAQQVELPGAKPFPAVQVIPLPYDQASFQYCGRELTRYHFGWQLHRPFLFPVVGPPGCSYTRMGHPHDPVGHSHHNSVWISHHDVAGISFWADSGEGRIVHLRVDRYEDGPASAWMLVQNAWQDSKGKTLMLERRRMEVHPLDDRQWLLTIDLQFEAPDKTPVTLGQTPFGVIGVRMAKTIGVNDGGGRILNSEGQLNEAEVFRKPARWVDYSGPVSPQHTGGITLMDHPSNPGHPPPFHVRNDGWMGACLTLHGPLTIEPNKPLRLRYRLWIHAGAPNRSTIDSEWRRFSQTELPAMVYRRK